MPDRDPDRDNTVRFDPSRDAGHVESHFLKANSPDGARAVWLKHTILARVGASERAVSEIWAIAFRRSGEHVAVKSTSSAASSRFSSEGSAFRVSAGDPESAGIELSAAACRGRAVTGDHALHWDLRFDPRSPPLRTYPADVMYTLPFPKQKALSPYPDAIFEGFADVDGERWSLDGWRGMQGHNWGARHTERYAWAHCNVLWARGDTTRRRLEDTWVELGAGRLKLGGWSTPWLVVMHANVSGERFDLSGPRAMRHAQCAVRDGTGGTLGADAYSCRVETTNGDVRVAVALSAPASGIVGLRYENPAGPLTHCLNSKIATCSVRIERGDRVIAELESDCAALELGTMDPSHGIALSV